MVASSWTPWVAQPVRQIEALGALEYGLERAGGRGLASIAVVRVGEGEQPAEVAPAAGVAHEQRQVAPVVQAQLGSVDRAQPERAGHLGELHRARDGVVIGQRVGVVAELQRAGDELLGQRDAVEEGVGGVGMQLDVGHVALSDPAAVNQPPPCRSWKTTRLRPSLLTTSQ